MRKSEPLQTDALRHALHYQKRLTAFCTLGLPCLIAAKLSTALLPATILPTFTSFERLQSWAEFAVHNLPLAVTGLATVLAMQALQRSRYS
jgi:hypothetical protein